GYLTPHGYKLMQIFGTYYRAQFAGQGLLSAQGCGDADRVTIYADSDQRTRETGKALSEGLFSGCAPATKGFAEGVNDPLFHPRDSAGSATEAEQQVAAIAGGIGGDPRNIAAAYRGRLGELDSILTKCGASDTSNTKRQSLMDISTTLSARGADHRLEI